MGLSFSSEERQLLREASPDQYLERERLILSAMQTEKGRQLLAQETVPYVRMTLDYQSIARKIFMLDDYEQGASLTYDKEATSKAYVLSRHGEVVTEEAGEDTFDVQPFEIVANPRVRKLTYRRRRYAMLDTLQKRGSEAIYKEEDIKAFALMSAALLPDNTQILTDGALTKNGLSTAFETIEEQYLAPATVLLDPKAMGDFRELDFGNSWTEATAAEMETTGKLGSLWGADIYVLPQVWTDPSSGAKGSYGTVWVLAAPEYLGVMVLIQDVESQDDVLARYDLSFGFLYDEAIGMAIGNEKSIVKLSVSA